MVTMLWCCLVAVFFNGALIVHGQSVSGMWSVADYPNPRTDPNACGRSDASYICDPDRLLEENEASQLERLLEVVRTTTGCPCSVAACSDDDTGIRIAVALVEQMYREDSDDALNVRSQLNKAIDFSYGLLSKWQLGRCDEEVIIFYSKLDNVFFTITGTQASKVLTSNVIGDIAMAVRQSFTPNTIFTGLEELISEYELVFTGDYVGKNYNVNPQAVVGGNSAGSPHPAGIALLSLLALSVLFA